MNKEIKINPKKIMIVNDEEQTLELKGVLEPKISNEDCLDLMKSKEVKIVYEGKKKDILDKEEKEYLASVIKPFRDKVQHISKQKIHSNDVEWLEMELELGDCAALPSFKEGTMYKGMKPYKDYTLEELGL